MFGDGNVYSLLKRAKRFLESKGLSEPESDVEVLLSFVLQTKRSKLPLMRSQKLTDIQVLQYERYILRRSKREPVAYIMGLAGFMDFEFKVNKNVLIPRPETEILVETALKIAKKENKNSVLDLCTGSGCIAVSLAKLGKFKDIMASDVSGSALEIARENARSNNVLDINFVKSNVFSGISGKNFDIIISNPPYVSHEEYDALEPELKYEPEIALAADDSGLFFYKKIAGKAGRYLNDNGFILIELNAYKAGEIKQIFSTCSYKNIEIVKDYAGLPRMLKAESNSLMGN
ncbi:peptide chain release factor N(5)-glutamine methyltransferase [Candidatus Endomicrobiellum trichonymphae]|uniref:Release factor glutamine methyltransferase n=1 Tax=Endomicrobium trichonymphae TaxID=1408204 RepID=B1GZI6_ENDTX|nr:peptide chain release factor N(5)-glutamine methyltransferase [Candidatus Endomicrobium trichonymphae]BAG13668.1 peptide chain release factor glutamine methyltransferase [Candidatus Endomicrobium trichonymphae]